MLHEGPHERVTLHALDGVLDLDEPGGVEVLVLDGQLDVHPRGTWLRRPTGPVRLMTEGVARLLVRSGHLANPPNLPSQRS